MLLHEGDRWQCEVAIDWAGTSSAPATVGAYYVEALKGLRGERPIIEGAGRYPAGGIYDVLVMVNTRDRVRVENLEVKDSGGRGINFRRSHYGEGVNVVVDGTYTDAILFEDSDHGSISRSLVTHAGLVFGRDGKRPWGGAITSAPVSRYGRSCRTSHDDLVIANDTLIDNNRQISGLSVACPGVLADNVLLSVSKGTLDVDSSDLSGIAARDNYFSRGDPGGGLKQAGNRYDGIALRKTSGWRTSRRRASEAQRTEDSAPSRRSARLVPHRPMTKM